MYIFLLQRPDGPSVLGQFSLEFPALVWNGLWRDVEVGREGRMNSFPLMVVIGYLFLGVSLAPISNTISSDANHFRWYMGQFLIATVPVQYTLTGANSSVIANLRLQ